MIVKLNEQALYALGFDRAGVEALRHLLRQVGAEAGSTTLPDVAQAQESLLVLDAFNAAPKTQQDVGIDSVFLSTYGADIANLSKQINEIRIRLEHLPDMTAQANEIKKSIQEVGVSYALTPAPIGVDWERPGKIGSLTRNTGAFTTLGATGLVTVTGTATTIASFRNTGAATGQIIVGNTAGDFVARVLADGTAIIYSDAGKNLDLGSNGATARMRVHSGGSVTIGATTDDGVNKLQVTGATKITGALITTSTLTTLGGATFHTTSSALVNGAGVGAGTIANAPAAGDPTKWIGINDNGTTRYIPTW